jgi:farnesyl diphosphate synthase
MVGAPADRLATVAGAVELIHAYSLVHDDLPCMDDDVLRRGKPTCHMEFDEATALLVGDALQSLAFELLSGRKLAPEPRAQLEMVRLLASAAGSRGMAGGQAIDLESIGKALSLPELEFMHIHKTGALIRASVLLGAYCGAQLDAEELARLDRFAKYIGLAFQVVDDVLDAESTTATLGKTAGKDADRNKPTYVQLLGVSRARELALEMRATAIDALAPFGPRAARLEELADFIVMRRF